MSARRASIEGMDSANGSVDYIENRFFEEEFLADQEARAASAAGRDEPAGTTTGRRWVRPAGETSDQAPAGALG